jgi:hypothetical protein
MGKLLVAGAALVNHPAGQIDDRIEKGVRRAAVLRLDMILSVPHLNIRVEPEIHRTASLSLTQKVTPTFLPCNWFRENTDISFGCI